MSGSAAEVVVLAKRPGAPGTKTRLAADLGAAAAADVYAGCLRSVVAAVLASGLDARISLHGDAADAGPFAAAYACGLPVTRQRGRDFADRQANEIERSLAGGTAACVLVASDLRTLEPRHLRWAASVAGAGAVAVVPSTDGGYSALASPSPLPELRTVGMSTSSTYDDLLAALRRSHEVEVAPFALADVDRAADLAGDGEARRAG